MKVESLTGFSEKFNRFEDKHRHIICYVYALSATVFWTTTDFLVKALPRQTSSQILFFRSLEMFGLTILMMDLKKMDYYFPGTTINRMLFSRGILGSLGMSLNFYGVKQVPVSEAQVISQTSPAIVGIFAVIFLKEKYTLTQFLGVLFCFCGVIFVVKPDFLFHLDQEQREESNYKFFGMIALLTGTIFTASTQILVKKIVAKTNEGVPTLYFAAIASMFSPIISLYQGFNPFSPYELLILLLIGTLSSFGQVLRNKAYILGNPGRISIMSYFGILYSMFVDVFIIGSILDFYSVIGAVFIFSSLFVFLYRTIQQENKQKEELVRKTVSGLK